MSGCASAVATLFGKSFAMASALVDDLGAQHYFFSRRGVAAPDVGAEAVLLRCQLPHVIHADSSPGAPVVAIGSACADTIAALIGTGFALVSSLVHDAVIGFGHYTLAKVPGGPPAAPADVAAFRCQSIGDTLFVSGVSASADVPPVVGPTCAAAIAGLTDAGFFVRSADAAEVGLHFTYMRTHPARRTAGTAAVTLRCIAGGGETTIPVTAVSASGSVPTVTVGTDCADAIASLLAKGLRLRHQLVGDGGDRHYVLVRTPADRVGRASEVAILRCVADSGTVLVGDVSSTPGAPAIPPFLSECGPTLAGLVTDGYSLTAALMDGPGSLHYTLIGP